jgi:ribosomal protein L37E
MTKVVTCELCGDKTTNMRTKQCDICKVKRLVATHGDKDYKKWISTR